MRARARGCVWVCVGVRERAWERAWERGCTRMRACKCRRCDAHKRLSPTRMSKRDVNVVLFVPHRVPQRRPRLGRVYFAHVSPQPFLCPRQMALAQTVPGIEQSRTGKKEKPGSSSRIRETGDTTHGAMVAEQWHRAQRGYFP